MRPLLSTRLALANLVAQAAIIFTGAVVRVTGSGLGCPTWPECAPGSFTPTAHQAEGWHKLVEFGNRTLTFVLGAIALALVISVFKSHSERRIRIFALTPLIGVLAQAVIGGITVLTKLHSGTLLLHFLVSVWLVWASARLWFELSNPNRRPAALESLWVGRVALWSGAAVMLLGSLTTSSGPHSGDGEVASSLAIDPRLTSWLHADSVWLFVGSLSAAWILASVKRLPAKASHSLKVLTALALSQAALGYLQYYSGLPWPLVAIHVLVAAAFWTTLVVFSFRAREVDSAS